MTLDPKTNHLDDDAAALAFASLSPGERLQYTLAQRQLAALEEANRIARAGRRAEENAEFRAQEVLRVAEEQHFARAANRREWRARVDVPLELRDVEGSPIVVVGVTVVGDVACEGEELAGKHRVSTCRDWDVTAAEAAITADTLAPHAATFRDFERTGDLTGAANLKSALLARGMESCVGVKTRMWRQVFKPCMQRLIRGPAGTLEDLIARGACQLAGEINVTETAPGVVVNPP